MIRFRLFLALLPAFFPALAQSRIDLTGVVPGDALGWEIQEFSVSVAVHKPTVLNIQIYSPGFDPADYRRALKGQEELGDERYDGGRGELRAEFVLIRDGRVLAREAFGVEPHRWTLFFRGQVEPGVYLLKSRLEGLGKNAFRYRVQTDVPEAASLMVEPGLQLYKVRREMVTADIRGQDWLEPFVLDVSPQVLPLWVGFYDEDDRKELEGRVRFPDGRVESRLVSGDRSWAFYDIRQPGAFAFGFRQPKTATQYSNTIGFWVDACREVEPRTGVFRVLPPRPVEVLVQDPAGGPVGIRPILEGDKVRTVRLLALPEGYRLVRLEVEGGELLPGGMARFGCPGGRARFVVERLAPPQPLASPKPTPPPPSGVPPEEPKPPARATKSTPPQPSAPPESTLEIEAALVLPEGEGPFDLRLTVNGQPTALRQGQARLRLPPGNYSLKPALEGARIEGPFSVELLPGKTQRVRYRVYPEVQLELEAASTLLRVGERTTLTARARSAFPDLLPAHLELALPPCLEPLDGTRLSSPVGQGRDAVLQVRVQATCKGEAEPIATLAPWSKEARTLLKIIQPATFALKKEALKDRVEVGGEAVWRLVVKNTGDEAGRVRLEDRLAGFDQAFELAPGEERTLQVRSPVSAEAKERMVNTARLLDAEGNLLAEAGAEVQVLRPLAELSRELKGRIVVPGEGVEVRLVVRNAGQAPLRYSLRDTYPEWLDPETTPEWAGELSPGESRVHTYRGLVRFGPPAEGEFLAQLTSNGGNLSAPDGLKRVLVPLEEEVQPARILQGGEATFTLRVKNPTDHPLSLRLQESPAEGLKVALPESLELTLEPGEERKLLLPAQAERAGALENQALALVGDTPASFPAKATLVSLPPLEPRRFSTVELPFEVKGVGAGEALLITHLPPKGATYEPGSARLDGKPIPDPRVDEEGRLFFQIPFQKKGLLSYALRHRDALGAPSEPTLTLRVEGREVYLKGGKSFADLEKAKPILVEGREGLIQEPLPGAVFQVDKVRAVVETQSGLEVRLVLNGEEVDSKHLGQATYDERAGLQRLEYYGLPLKPGRNLIEVQTPVGSDRVEVFLAGRPVRLSVQPIRLVADGRTPPELLVRAVDRLGLASGFGPLTVEASQEPLDEDAFPLISGYQVLLKDGVARLRLKPIATPTSLRLRLAFGEIAEEAEFFVGGKTSTLWQFQGSVGVRIGGSFELFALGRGYLEAPLGQGVLRGALDGSLRSGEGGLQLETGLKGEEDPTGRFPLTGSGTEAQMPLRSDEPLALRYDQEGFSLGYYAGRLSVFGVEGLPQATALRLETRGRLALQGFAGYLPVKVKTERIIPDGTRYYKLSQPAEPASEQVFLLVGSQKIRLERLRDYVLDAETGTLILSRPLWPESIEVLLEVTYAPKGGAREPGYGAGVQWKAGGFSVALGAAYLPSEGWRTGLEAAYRAPGFSLKASYDRGMTERYGLELSGKTGPLEANANLAYEDRLRGQARIAYSLSEADRLSLEHQAGEGNRTDLLYTRRLSPGFSVGVGLGYTWEEALWAGLGRLSLKEGPLGAELTHAQPLGPGSATTRLRSTYAFDPNLTAEADLRAEWGQGLSGTFGLRQKLAGANLSLSYQLPGASGEGNRARFGLEAPLPLDERWSLNASAGYERSLSTGENRGAFGLALRYKTQDFSATLGGEAAFGALGPKAVLRAGAAGQLSPQQVLSLDATYGLLPTSEGRFTLAYALWGREVSLLTYHRLQKTTERTLEGALAMSWRPGLPFGLRPSFAYRLKLDDPAGNTYGLGLGANYYFGGRFGLGGGVYYLFQPGTGTSATAFGVEGSLRIAEGLWSNLGYTFGGSLGLTPDTAPGLYLRLDFLGGGE